MRKRIVLIMVCFVASFPLFAQNTDFDKVFNSFAKIKGMTTLTFTGNLFTKLLTGRNTNNDCSISSLKILTVEDSTLNAKLNFYHQIIPNLNKKEYEELMSVKESGQDFVILYKKENHKITEVILISGGNDNSLIYIKGSLSMSNLQEVSQGATGLEKLMGMKQVSLD
jgi:hypothetical protein